MRRSDEENVLRHRILSRSQSRALRAMEPLSPLNVIQTSTMARARDEHVEEDRVREAFGEMGELCTVSSLPRAGISVGRLVVDSSLVWIEGSSGSADRVCLLGERYGKMKRVEMLKAGG